MIAECAFVGCFRFRVEIPGTVWARLNAISAPDATVLIDKNNAILCLERRSDGTNLHAGRLIALVTQFWYEEASHYIPLTYSLIQAFKPRIDILDDHLTILLDGISLHPCAEVKRFFRDVVFVLARFSASAAPDALVYLNAHAVIVF
jgi:hypothetical protein